LSKNCITTTKKNIESIIEINKEYEQINLNCIFVDSDSTDGTKELLNEYSKNYDFIKIINEDNLEEKLKTRIERISHCRNICLEEIHAKFPDNNLIYIPLDLDVDQFQITNINKFIVILKKFVNSKDIQGCFPVSSPYYYDIFALRAKGWLNINSQLIVNKFKKYIPLGSFFWNYFFIFRKQWKIEKIKKSNYDLKSAFGGAGMYKINNTKSREARYSYSSKNTNFVSEHIYFNNYFNNLVIDSNWIVPAPEEHLEFKALNLYDRFFYILKTFKFDLKNNLLFFLNNKK